MGGSQCRTRAEGPARRPWPPSLPLGGQKASARPLLPKQSLPEATELLGQKCPRQRRHARGSPGTARPLASRKGTEQGEEAAAGPTLSSVGSFRAPPGSVCPVPSEQTQDGLQSSSLTPVLRRRPSHRDPWRSPGKRGVRRPSWHREAACRHTASRDPSCHTPPHPRRWRARASRGGALPHWPLTTHRSCRGDCHPQVNPDNC